LRTVSRNRDERVAKSMTRIPPTLSGLVQMIAAVLWLLIYIYSFHNRSTGPLCYSVAALVLFIANFVMTDTDNPLKGLWNVRPDSFSEVPR
jgi:fatty acid desaturase